MFLVRNESSPLGISSVTVALDFRVFLAQAIRHKMRSQQNVEMACSANQKQVFSSLDQSGVNNFALGERKIRKKCPLFRPIII